jgi:hypothetical protein
MSNKLIVTEAQYQRLLNFINETPFDTMVKNTMKVGDTVVITWKNSKNNFKVIDNTSGHVIMDNIDSGSSNINYRYYMVYTGLSGDDLELRRVHKINEKDKLTDFKEWSPMTVKDITNIQVFRGGKQIDIVDPLSPTAEKQQKQGTKNNLSGKDVSSDFTSAINQELRYVLENLDKEKGFKLSFNNGDIMFCCLAKSNNTFTLELIKETNKTLPDLNKWDTYILEIKGDVEDETTDFYSENQDILSTNDNLKLNLKFKVVAGNNNGEAVISGIQNFSVTTSCESDEEEGEEKSKEEQSPEELKADGQLAFKMILADPELKAAFYTQPTFWQAFVADLRGDKPTGAGIIPTLDLLGKYGMNKIKQKIGDGFVIDNDAKYQLLKTIEIPYKTSKNTNDIETLRAETDYIRVRRHVIEDRDQVLIKQLNKNLDLRIIVKNKTEDPNIYNCEIEVGKLKKGGNWENLTLDTVEANVRFLQSKGYNEQKEETTK